MCSKNLKSNSRYYFLLFLLNSTAVFANDLQDNECKDTSIVSALTCGQVSGSVRLYSYSDHNDFFSQKNLDTTSTGGYLNYTTGKFYNLSATVGINGQLPLLKSENSFKPLNSNQLGLSEAYIEWKSDKFSVTIGNQRLNLPFLGEWSSWRVLPWLYRGVDIKYGTEDNYINLTKVTDYKNYSTDDFSKTSKLYDDNSYKGTTKGLLSFGAVKKIILDENKTVKNQFWYEKYYDIENLFYTQSDLFIKNKELWNPIFGIQALYAKGTGNKYISNINNKTLGLQIILNPKENLKWQFGYNKIFKNKDAFQNGALVTPYAHLTGSGPLFAQPFLSSTQDSGSGSAYSTQLSSNLTQQLSLSARYTFIDMTKNQSNKDINLSEYLIFWTYKFSGNLKNLTLTNFTAVQSKPVAEKKFIQNRLQLSYNF